MCWMRERTLGLILSLFMVLFTCAGCGGGGGGGDDNSDPKGEATLTVVSSSPANGAQGVAREAQIGITFSQPIDPATLNGSTVILSTSGTTISTALTLNEAGSGLTITPSFPLGAGATSTVTVTPGVKDRQGNFLASNYTLSFTTVDLPAPGGWTKVSAGRDNGIALNENETIWAWGCNYEGQVGNGEQGSNGDPNQDDIEKHQLDVSSPTQVGSNPDWKTISSGNHISFGIMNNGMLLAWGDGFLGNGSNEALTPTRIGADTDWDAVEASIITQFACALKLNGTLWVWGSNAHGQIGIGQIGNQIRTPTLVNNDADWDMVATGGSHVVALKNNGTLWTWGCNQYGQLGNGTNGTRVVTNNVPEYLDDNHVNSPRQIGIDSNWVFVATKGNFTMAIKRDGSLWAWGGNEYGQLGLGTVSEVVNIPTRVGTDADWESVAPGANHTVAIKRNGTLWSWGSNGNGQLGTGTALSRSAPGQIGTDAAWSSASSGEFFSIAIKDDGTLWTWGRNNYYQLGNGTKTNSNVPGQL